MKKTILLLATISILSCTKKQDDPKPSAPQLKTQSTTSSICKGDTTYTILTVAGTPTPFVRIYETCTHVTIFYSYSGKTVKVEIPPQEGNVSNYPKNTEGYCPYFDEQKELKLDENAIYYCLNNVYKSNWEVYVAQKGQRYLIFGKLKR